MYFYYSFTIAYTLISMVKIWKFNKKIGTSKHFDNLMNKYVNSTSLRVMLPLKNKMRTTKIFTIERQELENAAL